MANSSNNQSKALAALRRMLGRDRISTDEKALFAASFDNARFSFLPDAVVNPRDENDVGSVLACANRYGIPLTVRGGGSAATGAASPIYGGWVLDLSRWTGIRVDAVTGMAYVQPGARIEKIQRTVEKRGWFYPPDPSSFKFSTIGGNIATNASGMRGAKYGVTRDYIYALEGFLPTGERVKWAADLKKFASGYNMRDLWIGSEGTLGVVTSAVLKLIPKPPACRTSLAAFKNEVDALRAVKALLRERVMPSILEFLDRQTVSCTERYSGRPAFPGLPDCSLLLIELDGYPDQLEEELSKVRAWAAKRAQAFHEAESEEEAERLKTVRRTCSQAMYQLGDTKLNEDIVVPLKNQIPLLRFTLELKKKYGLATPTFGHAADGNFHVHVMFDRDNRKHKRMAEKAVKAVMQKVVELGGAITGEHGIGLAKSAFLELQHNRAEIEAMKAVKRALDPNNILNPGKIFEPFAVWKHEPLKVRLPWDH